MSEGSSEGCCRWSRCTQFTNSMLSNALKMSNNQLLLLPPPLPILLFSVCSLPPLIPVKRCATAATCDSEVGSGTRRGKWKNFRTYYIYFSITFFFSIWFPFCYLLHLSLPLSFTSSFCCVFGKFARRLRFCCARHVVFNLFWQQRGTSSIK